MNVTSASHETSFELPWTCTGTKGKAHPLCPLTCVGTSRENTFSVQAAPSRQRALVMHGASLNSEGENIFIARGNAQFSLLHLKGGIAQIFSFAESVYL